METDEIRIRPLGVLRTCFPEKLGIPRQSGLLPEARGVLRFSDHHPPEVWRHALEGLDGFRHVWITFVFDRAALQGWKSRVRPPRLDGREKVGVFATRSPHRPNFLGLSLCRLERVSLAEPFVEVSGVDILDGTPVVDLRPFHPDNDLPPAQDVSRGWLERAAEPSLPVTWEPGALEGLEPRLARIADLGMPDYSFDQARALVEGVVGLDPRPAHRRGTEGDWYARILSFDVRVRVEGGTARIREIRDWDPRAVSDPSCADSPWQSPRG
jgi:tRNA-Thr(GGU) m(6)t(6)A37 methyltransferase TsaA